MAGPNLSSSLPIRLLRLFITFLLLPALSQISHRQPFIFRPGIGSKSLVAPSSGNAARSASGTSTYMMERRHLLARQDGDATVKLATDCFGVSR